MILAHMCKGAGVMMALQTPPIPGHGFINK